MSRKRFLYVVHIRKDSPHSYLRLVYCYAFSECHAVNLAIKYCHEHLGWPLDALVYYKPTLLIHFVR